MIPGEAILMVIIFYLFYHYIPAMYGLLTFFLSINMPTMLLIGGFAGGVDLWAYLPEGSTMKEVCVLIELFCISYMRQTQQPFYLG